MRRLFTTVLAALVAPAGLPPAIAAKLNRETLDILNSAEMKEAMTQQGLVPDSSTPDALAAQIRGDIVKWGTSSRRPASSRSNSKLDHPRLRRLALPGVRNVSRIAWLSSASVD